MKRTSSVNIFAIFDFLMTLSVWIYCVLNALCNISTLCYFCVSYVNVRRCAVYLWIKRRNESSFLSATNLLFIYLYLRDASHFSLIGNFLMWYFYFFFDWWHTWEYFFYYFCYKQKFISKANMSKEFLIFVTHGSCFSHFS